MGLNIFKEHLPQVEKIVPQSVAAAGNATSGWVSADSAPDFLAVINTGALGGGTVTPTFEQATDNAGTGAKAISGWDAGAALSANNAQSIVMNPAGALKLDTANGFKFFRLKLSNVGGTGALVSASLHGVLPRYR
jgi:hypothetical protein